MTRSDHNDIPEGTFEADYYCVSGSGDKWLATVFYGINIVEEIRAVSEKQAHFIAMSRYPRITRHDSKGVTS